MTYQFDTEDAEKHGLPEAVMLFNLRFWITKNKANETNEHEIDIDDKTVARTWTFNSITAFVRLFPFWTYEQVKRILSKLISQKVLIKGNFNKIGYDRTAWYAFTDESFLKNLKSTPRSSDRANREISPMEEGNFPNGTGKIPSPIPDIKPDSNTNNINAENGVEKKLKTTEKKPPKNDLEKIEQHFVEIHKKEYDIEPEISFGKVRSLEKNLLKRHSAEEICAVIDLAVKDDWIKQKNTFELSTVLSAEVFNRLMRNGHKKHVEKVPEDKMCPECGNKYVGSCCKSCGWSV